MDIGKYRAEKAPPSALHDKYREELNKVISDTAIQEQRIRDRQVRERIRERRSKGPDESADAMITAMRKLASESEAELEEMHQLVHKERWEHHRAACDLFMEHFPDLSAEESSNGQMPLHQKIRNSYMRSNCHSPRSRAPASSQLPAMYAALTPSALPLISRVLQARELKMRSYACRTTLSCAARRSSPTRCSPRMPPLARHLLSKLPASLSVSTHLREDTK